jgi:D-glycero-D-manno-heptose 1,7-bisphosphate phosphatase
MTRPAVFLDRDGVLNPLRFRAGRLRAPLALSDFQPFPWAAGAVDRLHGAGWPCLVVTNQPDVAAGDLTVATLDAMHGVLRARVGVDDVYVCPHGRTDGCGCRKPQPGLLLAAADDWSVDLAASFFVGDRAVDVEAARAAGCRSILVDGAGGDGARPDYRARDLRDAVTVILSRTDPWRRTGGPR